MWPSFSAFVNSLNSSKPIKTDPKNKQSDDQIDNRISHMAPEVLSSSSSFQSSSRKLTLEQERSMLRQKRSESKEKKQGITLSNKKAIETSASFSSSVSSLNQSMSSLISSQSFSDLNAKPESSSASDSSQIPKEIRTITKPDSIWTGEFQDDQLNGQGKLIWTSGSRKGQIWEGVFSNNELNGKGKIIWPNNDVWEGEFRKNNLNGQGMIIWSSKEIWQGEFINSQLNGQGKMIRRMEQFFGKGNSKTANYTDRDAMLIRMES